MPPTQSRRSYTAAFKLEVAIYAEEKGGNMAAQRKYGVNEKVIRGWRKQKETLRTKSTLFKVTGRIEKNLTIKTNLLQL
jgi:transposase-like protein